MQSAFKCRVRSNAKWSQIWAVKRLLDGFPQDAYTMDGGVLCYECGEVCASLAHHFRYHPECAGYETGEEDGVAELVEEDDKELFQEAHSAAARAQVAWDLSTLRYKHNLDNGAVAAIKTFAESWIQEELAEVAHRVQPLLKSSVASLELESAFRVKIFSGLETAAKEEAYRKATLNPLQPRSVDLDDGDVVASFDMAKLLERKLQTDKRFRAQVETASDAYKTGKLHKQPAGIVRGFEDGDVARNHPHLLREATLEEEHDLRIPLVFNCDDIEVSRALYPTMLLKPPVQ